MRRAEVVGEELFVVAAGHAWIALLDFAEQAFFGGEERAVAVDVDGSAFEDDAGVAVLWADFTSAGGVGHLGADLFVVAVVGVFGPGVEAEFESLHIEGSEHLR